MSPQPCSPTAIAPRLHAALLVLLLVLNAAPAADQAVPPKTKTERTDAYGDPLPEDAVRRIGSVRFRAGAVLALFPCPDGKTLISSGPHVACVWELATGRLTRRLPGDWIALSPSGSMLATAHGKTIHLWDLASGRELRQLKGHAREVLGLAFSPDGKMLASGDRQRIHLWNAARGTEIATLPRGSEDPSPVWLTFTSDGKTLLVASRFDPNLHAWDVAARRQRRETPFQDEGGIISFALSADGMHLTTGTDGKGGEGLLSLFDVTAGKQVREMKSGRELVHVIAFSPDGKLLASAGADTGAKVGGDVRVWDRTTGRQLHCFQKFAHSLAFSRDGKTLFAGGDTICRWDLATGEEIQPPEGNLLRIDALALSPDGRALASLNWDVGLWDTATGKLLRRIAPAGEKLIGCAFSPDGKTLVTASLQSFLRLWDVSTGKEVRGFRTGRPSHIPWERGEFLLAVAFAPDGKTLATTNWSGTLCFWDARTGEELRRIRGLSQQHQYLESLAFTPDSRRVFTATRTFEGTEVRAWDVGRGEELRDLTAAINARMRKIDADYSNYGNWARLALSKDGRLLALNREKTISVWDTSTGKERLRLKGYAEPTLCVAFAPDGRLLASSGPDGTIRLRELDGGAEVGRVTGHRGNVVALVFSPDGKLLYSGGEDTSVLVWDVARVLRRAKQGAPRPAP